MQENLASTSDAVSSLVEDLAKFSLTRLESRIYLNLLLGGQSKASEIARGIDTNRIDVYRCLKGLRQRGIVEIILSRPLVFRAVEPEVLKEILVSEKEQHLKAFKTELDSVKKKLDQIPRHLDGNASGGEIGGALRHVSTEHFTIKSGRQIAEKWQRMANEASSQVLIILSRIGLMTHSVEGFADVYTKAAKRNVEIRMITNVVEENFRQAKEFSQMCKLRVSPAVDDSLRYVISDSREVMISMGSFSNNQRDFAAIWTTKPLLVKAFRLDFEDRWKRSRPFNGQNKR